MVDVVGILSGCLPSRDGAGPSRYLGAVGVAEQALISEGMSVEEACEKVRQVEVEMAAPLNGGR